MPPSQLSAQEYARRVITLTVPRDISSGNFTLSQLVHVRTPSVRETGGGGNASGIVRIATASGVVHIEVNHCHPTS
jgi:hypothetical protein